MRILMVEPGPNFSVQDVHRGWLAGFRECGVDVASYNLSDRILFWDKALYGQVPDDEHPHASARMACEGLLASIYTNLPDVVFVTSSFFVPPEHYDLIRQRGTKMVALLTESPYEDPAQYHIAARADMAIVNDPTNLDTFRQHQPNTWFVPHAYDPDVHKPGPATAKFKSDFGWVGTAYPSRRRFFEACDFTGLDVVIGGNWSELDDLSPLNDYLVNDKEHCLENTDAVEVYRSTKASVNLYRQEAASDDFVAGWAMGPREVELAATGCFYLTEPRPENQQVLPMVPTFTEPGEFSELLRWYLAHDDTRQDIARRAREAIAERTFANNCRFVLDRLASLPVPRLAGLKQQEPNREESNG